MRATLFFGAALALVLLASVCATTLQEVTVGEQVRSWLGSVKREANDIRILPRCISPISSPFYYLFSPILCLLF